MGLLEIFKSKPKHTPEEAAQRLFSSFVSEDEATVMALQYDDLKTTPGFQSRDFERQKFIYLAASVAIALTNASSRYHSVIKVIPYFRRLVIIEMRKRWGDCEEIIDSDLEEASGNYAALLFTNPSDNRDLSFEWSKVWLARIGVEENNPAALFLITAAWKTQFLQASNYLAQIQVVG